MDSDSPPASQKLPVPRQLTTKAFYESQNSPGEQDLNFQETMAERRAAVPTSPQRPSTAGSTSTMGQPSRKEKGKPSVTPRRFKQLFTPRSHGTVPSIREALHDITGPRANSRDGIQSSPIRSPLEMSKQENTGPLYSNSLKRRKVHNNYDTKERDIGFVASDSEDDELEEDIPPSPCDRPERPEHDYFKIHKDRGKYAGRKLEPAEKLQPIRRNNHGLVHQLRNMQLGAAPTLQHMVYPDFQNETGSFYSRPTDIHYSRSLIGPHRVVPFCTASLNTNSLTAIGDEEGRVRLLESTKDGKKSFKDVFLGFRVHTNAIIDMAFSEDDTRLATASGDQTARVVDMNTQTTITILGKHNASLKQVRFQPGANNNSVVATTGRDGCVHIWDVRCAPEDGPVQELRGINGGMGDDPPWSRPIISIFDAHRQTFLKRTSLAMEGNDVPMHGEASGRMGQVSVTCMSFLAQENLLVTGSEKDATIKLWDLRSLHRPQKGKLVAPTQYPVSETAYPESHSQWRHFGTTSISISGDGSRLYSLCKDNTVYAYSTAHLILGHAPELSQAGGGKRFATKKTKEGLGPICGYRHPKLFATSFYVKSAIRKAKDGKSEMLAVGSNDGCVVLFPTDDVFFPKHELGEEAIERPPTPVSRAQTQPASSYFKGRPEESLPISSNGTALTRGHNKEVNSLSWTSEGNLISIADDFLVRVWRDDASGEDAEDLRMGGEHSGRTWGCGWADVNGDFDDDEWTAPGEKAQWVSRVESP